MCKSKKRQISNAVLMPAVTLTQFVIGRLLEGIVVQVTIDGRVYEGYVHLLDFAKGNDYVFANVCVPDPDDEKEIIDVRVAIKTDGTVDVMPNQLED